MYNSFHSQRNLLFVQPLPTSLPPSPIRSRNTTTCIPQTQCKTLWAVLSMLSLLLNLRWKGCIPSYPWGKVALHAESPLCKVLIADHYRLFFLPPLSFNFLVYKMRRAISSNFQECCKNYVRLIMWRCFENHNMLDVFSYYYNINYFSV